jgi:hypothetical protein
MTAYRRSSSRSMLCALTVAASVAAICVPATNALAQDRMMQGGDRMRDGGMHGGRGIGIGVGTGIANEMIQQGARARTDDGGDTAVRTHTTKPKRAAKKRDEPKKQNAGKNDGGKTPGDKPPLTPTTDKPPTQTTDKPPVQTPPGTPPTTIEGPPPGGGVPPTQTTDNPPPVIVPPVATTPPPETPQGQYSTAAPCPEVAAINRRQPWGNITFKNCCGQMCPNGPTNQQIADMLYNGCDRAKKALSLINQMLPDGRDGVKRTLENAGGGARANIDDLNGTTSDSWNAVLLHDTLVNIRDRCEKEFTLECENCDGKVPGNIYSHGNILQRRFSNIHVCTTVSGSAKNWCTDAAGQQEGSLLHEVTHLVGVDHEDKPFTTYQVANALNALIPNLANAYDRLNAPPPAAAAPPAGGGLPPAPSGK